MSPDRETFRRKAAEKLQPAKSAIGRIPTNRGEARIAAAHALWEVTRIAVRHEIIDPEGHFQDARDHLEAGGSLLVIINHFDRLDTTIAGHVIEQNVTPLDRVAGITSLKYLDPDRSRLISRVIDTVQQVKGFSTIPVIQDKKEEVQHYTENPKRIDGKTPRRFNREATIEAIEYLRVPGNVLMMAPEGTRSPQGKLLKGHEGLDSIMRMARTNALVLPIALIPPYVRRIIPPYSRVSVVPGELFSLEDILQETETHPNPDLTLTDRMMVRLAELIPPKNRGYYRPFVKPNGSHRIIPPHPDVSDVII